MFARGPSPTRLAWLDYLVCRLPGVGRNGHLPHRSCPPRGRRRASILVAGAWNRGSAHTAHREAAWALGVVPETAWVRILIDVSSCVLDAHCSPTRLARCLLCRTRRWFNKERNEYTQAFRKVLKQKKCASACAMVRARCTAHDRRCCGWQMWSANCGRRKQNARHHVQKCLPFGHGCRKCRLVFVALWWLSSSHPCCTRRVCLRELTEALHPTKPRTFLLATCGVTGRTDPCVCPCCCVCTCV